MQTTDSIAGGNPSGREARSKRFLIERTTKALVILFAYKHVLAITKRVTV